METIFTDGQLTKLIDTMRQKQMTSERFNAILSSGILADVLDPNADLGNRKAVRAALKLGVIMPEVFLLTVDYGQSLKQMIVAGRYDWENNDITTKRFPIEGKGIVEFEACYFHFNRNISSKKAIEAIKNAGLEPAKIEHLLSFGLTFPEEQRKFMIIGLSSVAEFGRNRGVPYLYRRDSGRDLDLARFDIDWHASCHFLAVRKVSAS